MVLRFTGPPAGLWTAVCKRMTRTKRRGKGSEITQVRVGLVLGLEYIVMILYQVTPYRFTKYKAIL